MRGWGSVGGPGPVEPGRETIGTERVERKDRRRQPTEETEGEGLVEIDGRVSPRVLGSVPVSRRTRLR